jgi:hypothetical protein
MFGKAKGSSREKDEPLPPAPQLQDFDPCKFGRVRFDGTLWKGGMLFTFRRTVVGLTRPMALLPWCRDRTESRTRSCLLIYAGRKAQTLR